MLTELHIQNIAVIHKASVHLQPGLNVFTGETGAGKTILLSAIDMVLGERTSKEIIRSGEEKALVTALFEDLSPAVRRELENAGYTDDEGSLLISREITATGKSTCKINGMPATASILKAISSKLIHIHGQRDSLQLLSEDAHMHMIDTFGELSEDLAAYQREYQKLCDIHQELASLEMDEAQKAQRIDMLTFQIQDIEAASLEDPDEEEVLQAQRKLIRNSEKIRNSLSESYRVLRGSGESEGILPLLDILTGSTTQAAEFLQDLEPYARRVEEMGYELTEFAQELRTTLDEFEFNPGEFEEIESRLDTIHKLKRKYGSSIEEILAFLSIARDELATITSSEQRIQKLNTALKQQTDKAVKLAEGLSRKRIKAAESFTKQVETELVFLDMPSVKLGVEHREKPLSHTGADEMEFTIVTNIGEVPKPLSKIASGGEVSRIMLAIKNVLAEKDDVATLIFDEVDSGVSGRAAQKIGQKLSQVSRARQVICVTHLAQVAAFGDSHLLIFKEVADNRTFTRINVLDEESRERELARITGGDLVTETTLQNARELLSYARKLALDK